MGTLAKYSEDALASALSNEHTLPTTIKRKNHFKYLRKYLEHAEIGAKTIVIEDNYISKDFLHDYASYYSLCFEKYNKVCKRVHFFALEFTETEFDQMLEGRQMTIDIPGSYLGFIVVKPIPFTVIGYTLLKTYSNSPTTRQFWGYKRYTVHLYGRKLHVDSLAFQEQDSILAACATTAIWCMLNKAADFQVCLLKSPNEITKDSGVLSNDGSRLFPNKGLDIRQICQAIYASGLATEVKQGDMILPEPPLGTPPPAVFHPYRKVVSKTYLKKILNAYSTIEIPLILVIGVPRIQGDYGLHAITVSGFKQSSPKAIPLNPEISYHSDNIEKFYAHDDQWGPFVRIEWHNEFEIITEWNKDTRRTYILQIVVPTFPKIRISYLDIEQIVVGMDRLLTTAFDKKIIHDLVWDIKIDFSSRYKEEIVSLDPAVFTEKLAHLKKDLPKYVWIATCYLGDKPAMKFVFDATGVNWAMLGKDIISLLPSAITSDIYVFLDKNKGNLAFVNVFSHPSNSQYYEFMLENLKPTT